MEPTDQESSYRAIERLIATYAELVDDGDFAAVGRLLSDATFTGSAGSVTGRDAIEEMLRDNAIVYDDGTPRTQHITTNLSVEVDEDEGTAVSRSYFTVLQALPDLLYSPSSAAGILTASNAATAPGVLSNDAYKPISSGI
jgi:3-phenylpropionate/cinnamic acid dioxygenase small subunit